MQVQIFGILTIFAALLAEALPEVQHNGDVLVLTASDIGR